MIINPAAPSQGGVTMEQVMAVLKAAVPTKTSELDNDSGFLTQHQDISGKLDKTGTAAAATKLATSRTIRTNLASTSTASFNGTANVTPGVTGVLPVANGGTGSSTEKYLPLAGGTLTGNLTLKGSGNYGSKINFGDGDYVHISEPTDDCLEIKAKKVNFVLSDTSVSNFTVNDSPLGGGGGLTLVADFTLSAEESRTFELDSDGTYLLAGFERAGCTMLIPMSKMNQYEYRDIKYIDINSRNVNVASVTKTGTTSIRVEYFLTSGVAHFVLAQLN